MIVSTLLLTVALQTSPLPAGPPSPGFQAGVVAVIASGIADV